MSTLEDGKTVSGARGWQVAVGVGDGETERVELEVVGVGVADGAEGGVKHGGPSTG